MTKRPASNIYSAFAQKQAKIKVSHKLVSLPPDSTPPSSNSFSLSEFAKLPAHVVETHILPQIGFLGLLYLIKNKDLLPDGHVQVIGPLIRKSITKWKMVNILRAIKLSNLSYETICDYIVLRPSNSAVESCPFKFYHNMNPTIHSLIARCLSTTSLTMIYLDISQYGCFLLPDFGHTDKNPCYSIDTILQAYPTAWEFMKSIIFADLLVHSKPLESFSFTGSSKMTNIAKSYVKTIFF